jgi:hypothetical protein
VFTVEDAGLKGLKNGDLLRAAAAQFEVLITVDSKMPFQQNLATLEWRVGYDAKNAAHLIRLLRMGIEFLTEGTLLVERVDAAELLDIKRGVWPLEEVKAEAERLFQLAQEAYVRSSLPPEPDRDLAERLCVEMISEYQSLRLG